MFSLLHKERLVIGSVVGFAILFMWINSGVGLNNSNAGEEPMTTGGGIEGQLHYPKTEPEELPKNVQDIRQEIIDSYRVDNNGDLLLYRTTNYEIEYITGFDFFFVNITFGDPEVSKTDAENWFKDFGLAQEDLCDLPVRFLIREPVIYDANPGFSTLPNGCS